ncbi:hypothetical protein Tco_0276775 [Tanacetum coccineum]
MKTKRKLVPKPSAATNNTDSGRCNVVVPDGVGPSVPSKKQRVHQSNLVPCRVEDSHVAANVVGPSVARPSTSVPCHLQQLHVPILTVGVGVPPKRRCVRQSTSASSHDHQFSTHGIPHGIRNRRNSATGENSLRAQPRVLGPPLEYRHIGICTHSCQHCGALFWYVERLRNTAREQPVKTQRLTYSQLKVRLLLLVIGARVHELLQQNRIDFIREHQNDIRNEYLSGIYDAITWETMRYYGIHGNVRRVRKEEDIDVYVSAELPPEDIDPECYRVVSELMMHGPCGLANPSASCTQDGDLFYQRMLLCHQKDSRSFPGICTVNDVVYPTCRAACEALGLLQDDQEWEITLHEAALTATPAELRTLAFMSDVKENRLLLKEKVYDRRTMATTK